jgi:ADP-ribosylglycohydrolase
MKHIWLYLSHSDIETERLQCEQEGKDLSSIAGEFERVLALDLEDPANQPAAEALLDATIELPIRADFKFEEPSDLEGIRAARPSSASDSVTSVAADDTLLEKLYGAWTGRCVGCLLGKPVEGWRRDRMWGYLKDLGRWPLADFFRLDVTTPEVRERYSLTPGRGAFADLVSFMPEDDDTNYTTTALAIMRRHGSTFTPQDVANFWLQEIPLLHTCTAERVAYRNLSLLKAPPASAAFRNPYREWIGAQIRADFWGYAAPGNPALAAEYAWRDASISHVKNGIYGEMWVAAMTAAAFTTSDPQEILRAGLSQIPARSRLADAIDGVLEWYDVEVDYDTAVYRVHELWNEKRAHDWCHTISNAMIVAIALLWGEGDYAKTICRAVQACFDTDCNGATTGSILGIIHGRKALPAHWVDVINDTLQTGVN